MTVALNIIGFILVVVSIFVFGLKGMTAEMGIAVAGSGIFLAFANLDKFSEFKGVGFEAKLRDAVNEANATIENLKSVAAPLLTTAINLLAKDGRWGGVPPFKKDHVLYNQLVSLQSEIDISDEYLEQAKAQYLNIHAWDMVVSLASCVDPNGNEKIIEKIGSHRADKPPSLEKLLLLLDQLKLLDDDRRKLEAIEQYYKHYRL